MRNFPDTSFLCALYREQENSDLARAVYEAIQDEILQISPAVAFEFRQSARLQVYLHRIDRSKGFEERDAQAMLRAFQSDLAVGACGIVSCDWAAILLIAEHLSEEYTSNSGHRSWDVLHVATAKHLRVPNFLSFDDRQRSLASACGLSLMP